ncbi:G-protein coupled receptor GRL101-like [Argopecten irradians]|uniref:G-protein coupled receptor GRL101-like n=1 Tax=Argopecten irradians TaxID=31199 RepID=UPI0037218B51
MEINQLNISSRNITIVPDNVFVGLSELLFLYLDSNKIRVLSPRVFYGLSNLVYLNLASNDIEYIPHEIFDGLTHLVYLILESNDIEVIPHDTFYGLSNLAFLNLASNGIEYIPHDIFDGLTHLVYLSLESNDIEVIPHDTFYRLSNLDYLNLASNDIEYIPHDIFYGLSHLTYLNLESNDIEVIPHDIFYGLSNLTYLHLHRNKIKRLPHDVFHHLSALSELDMSSNNIVDLPNKLFHGLHDLFLLDISNNYITEIPLDMFLGLGIQGIIVDEQGSPQYNKSTVSSTKQLKIEHLNLSYNNLTHLPTLPSTIQNLNIMGNKLIVKEHMFDRLENLTKLLTDTPFMCCVKPLSVADNNCIQTKLSFIECVFLNCKSEVDAISSCFALVGSTVLRVCLWMIGTSAFIGNLLVIVYRLSLDRHNIKNNYSLFTLNLAISDLLMAIYLLTIGVIDMYYDGVYAWNDQKWRNSILCTTAGVMSTVSSEMSTFLILLVTIDRLIVVMFPLSRLSRGDISWRLAVTASVLLWIVSITLAVIPIVTMQSYFNGEFYSQSGVCLALPLTGVEQPGTEYSFAVFVCLNSILFAVIFLGQICICKSLRKSGRHITLSQNRQRERSVATTLFFVVMTDFCCWFPIGVMGVLSRYGIQIPDEVYAWVMVFVLPVNAAINPFLYTASAVWRKRRYRVRN